MEVNEESNQAGGAVHTLIDLIINKRRRSAWSLITFHPLSTQSRQNETNSPSNGRSKTASSHGWKVASESSSRSASYPICEAGNNTTESCCSDCDCLTRCSYYFKMVSCIQEYLMKKKEFFLMKKRISRRRSRLSLRWCSYDVQKREEAKRRNTRSSSYKTYLPSSPLCTHHRGALISTRPSHVVCAFCLAI